MGGIDVAFHFERKAHHTYCSGNDRFISILIVARLIFGDGFAVIAAALCAIGFAGAAICTIAYTNEQQLPSCFGYGFTSFWIGVRVI